MENQTPVNRPSNSSDEVDLGKLFEMIGNGFNAIFRFFLRIFVYLKKNMYILLGIVVVGLAMGYGLNKITSKRLKTEIIVKPQIESKNYLYDVVNEIQSNIRAKDTSFFNSIGIQEIDFKALEISIAPVDDNKVNTENEMKYLELLQSFENTDAIADIVRAELQNQSSFNHRITLFYDNATLGNDYAKKIMTYINSNPYFMDLIAVYRNNANDRITQNEVLLQQVDEIIKNYTTGLASQSSKVVSDRIIVDNKEQVNIADLFEYKNRLIRDIEMKKLELKENIEPVNIINFGKPQVVQKPFFGKNTVLLPLLFLSVFFALSFLSYLNRRSRALIN